MFAMEGYGEGTPLWAVFRSLGLEQYMSFLIFMLYRATCPVCLSDTATRIHNMCRRRT
jgi:hypothetical protein